MSHHLKSGYRELVQRVNKFPQGAPPSKLLYEILSLLISEKEAALLSRLPLRPFSARRAARAWGIPSSRAEALLEGLATRGMLLDLEREGTTLYLLPPPMAGFFEFSLMRVRPGIDQQELSRLLFEYLNVEEDFTRALFAGGPTQIGRVFVNELALSDEQSSRVLDYERASVVIAEASHIALGLCYCRHKMAHLGRACDAPLEICMTFNAAAHSLIRHGSARGIDAVEALDLLQEARDRNLVHCGDNVRSGVNFICHCCGCCCEPLVALQRLGIPKPLHTTRFLAAIDRKRCSGCGGCVTACPVQALAWDAGGASADSAAATAMDRGKAAAGEGAPAAAAARAPGGALPETARSKGRVKVNEVICLGCGVCVRACRAGALHLEERGERVLTPANSAHRVVLMAIERGTLQHLVFDNQAHLSHRVMAAVLGAILKLPPVKQVLASRQLKSRYLERLLADKELAAFGN